MCVVHCMLLGGKSLSFGKGKVGSKVTSLSRIALLEEK